MTGEEIKVYIHEWLKDKYALNSRDREVLTMSIKALEFAEWVADEIFSSNWKYNKECFEEIACRKLEKIGFVKKTDTEWILVESEVNV